MKKRFRRITSAFLSAALMLGCVGFSASAEQSNLTPAEQYAAYIDSLDWPGYDNHIDMIEAAQIPEYILNQMSTEDLVEAMLIYPLRVDLIAWNTYEQGFDAVSSYFNGLQELLTREDGAQKLLEKMQSIPVVMSTVNINHEQYMRPLYLEVLLAQPEFMNQLSEQETEEALAIVDNIIESREENQEVYGGNAYTFYKATNEEIQLYTYDDYVRTPKNTPVLVRVWSPNDQDDSPAAKQQLLDDYKRSYPSVGYMGPATRRYNCHSYAWYWQSTNNNAWMGDARAYTQDGSYTKSSSMRANTRVAYRDNN